MPEISPEIAADIINVFGDAMTADHVGHHFTCTEANRIAELLRELDDHEAADTWLWGHSEGDDDGDSHTPGTCEHCGADIRGDGFDDEETRLWVGRHGERDCPSATSGHNPKNADR